MVAAPVKPLELPVFPLLMGNNGGAMLGPKGPLAPPKFLKKNMSRYINIWVIPTNLTIFNMLLLPKSRINIWKMLFTPYFYNTFTTNLYFHNKF